jgi:hypothetical protein
MVATYFHLVAVVVDVIQLLRLRTHGQILGVSIISPWRIIAESAGIPITAWIATPDTPPNPAQPEVSSMNARAKVLRVLSGIPRS